MPESAGHWKKKFDRKRRITGGPFKKPRRKTMTWIGMRKK